jgi:hypothetical protein
MVLYKLDVIPRDPWTASIDREYTKFKTEYRPRNAAVPYLVFSGITFSAYKKQSLYFPEKMADSYAIAFQIHQKPLKTAEIHKKWIRKLQYFWYLILVATPVDIYAHTYQLIFGERGAFLEGGAFFIPYQLSHWTLLSVALMAQFFHAYCPQSLWFLYFKFLRFNLIVHEMVYRLTLRKLTLFYRILEFSAFLLTIYLTYLLNFNTIDGLINSIQDFHTALWSLHTVQSLYDSFFISLQ